MIIHEKQVLLVDPWVNKSWLYEENFWLKSFNRFDAQLVILVESLESTFSQRDAKRGAAPVVARSFCQEICEEYWRRVWGTEGKIIITKNY